MISLLEPNKLPEEARQRFPLETAYIEQFARCPSNDLIRNVATTVQALVLPEALLPVTVDRPQPGNCYVVSPTCAYSDYARFELYLLPNRCIRSGLNGLITALGHWFRRVRLDEIVHINNWLLSTNLYPPWGGEELAEITATLRERYPEKAVAFRSINTYSHPALLEKMTQQGFLLLPSRQVYIQDARSENSASFTARRDFKQDARLFAQSGYRVGRPDTEQNPEVFDRIETLYNRLYLEKYTPLNPQFTSRWIGNGHRDGWLNLFCLFSPEGRMDGVAGTIQCAATMTTPVLGYDTALPQELGLYRMLSWICLNEALQKRLTLNSSAGAAKFKQSRGAVPSIEYSAVYVKHLRPERKFVWRMLASLLNRYVAPMMRRYKL